MTIFTVKPRWQAIYVATGYHCATWSHGGLTLKSWAKAIVPAAEYGLFWLVMISMVDWAICKLAARKVARK